jgi:hypothetical protein
MVRIHALYGKWRMGLSKVDMPGMRVKATFVFGQMNEPPELVLV